MSNQPPDLEEVPCPSCGARDARYERVVAGYRLERCRGCGLVFVNPRPTEHALTQRYLDRTADGEADFYAKTVSAAQIGEYRRILSDVIRLQPNRGRLLDLGCAAGYFLQQAAQAGFEAHGTDLATWVEEVAAVRGVPNVHAGVLRDAAFPDAHFDVVHSSQVFEHLPEPRAELEEIRRVLRPGGILYINVPNYRCLSIVLGRDDFELNTPPEHVSYFTPRTLARLVSTTGFRVIRTSSYGGLKWENLLGRPIRSEIAEAVRPAGGQAAEHPRATGEPVTPSWPGAVARAFFYRRLQVGMSLEVFAQRT